MENKYEFFIAGRTRNKEYVIYLINTKFLIIAF